MEPQTSFTLLTLLLNLILNSFVGVLSGADQYSRNDFPADFIFGSGTSAYQVSSLFLSCNHFFFYKNYIQRENQTGGGSCF
jgi:hypothetical protein